MDQTLAHTITLAENFFFKFTNNCAPIDDNAYMLVYGYASIIISMSNIFVNALALYIFQDIAWKNNPMILLLKSFAFIETLFNFWLLLHLLCMEVAPSRFFLPYYPKVALMIENVVLLLDCILIAFQLSRNWIVVALAYARYLIICRSTSVNTSSSPSFWFTNKTRCYFYVFLWTLGFFLLAMPRKLDFTYDICQEDAQIAKEYPFLINSVWFTIYLTVIMFLFQSGGPVILVITFSALIIFKIRRTPGSIIAQQQRKHEAVKNSHENVADAPRGNFLTNCFSNSQPRDSQPVLHQRRSVVHRSNASRLVIALCITFSILEMPSFLSKLFSKSRSIGMFANICMYIDSTLNFFIYIFSNQTFRHIFKKRFSCCFRDSHPQRDSQLQTEYLTILRQNNQDGKDPPVPLLCQDNNEI